MVEWLKKNKEFLKISAIEKEIGCPSTTLQKWIKGDQGLPGRWVKPLEKWIQKFINSSKIS